MNKNKRFKLNIEDNYHKNINYKYQEILSKYIALIKYYIIHSYDNGINKNKSILISGIDMVTNIYRLLLLYTNNLELTIYHTNNSIYYYIEYMSQITDTDDNIFFNLTMKDAVMYVYNKTLFDINKKFSKTIKNDNFDYLNNLNTITYLIKKMDFINITSNQIENSIVTFTSKLLSIINIDLNKLNDILKEYNNKNKIIIDDNLFSDYLIV